MSTVGTRLREERERLGLSRAKFIESAGITEKSQFNYEEDKRSPDATYLAAVAQIGVDVLYVLTGRRTLNTEDVELLSSFMELSPEDRQALSLAIRAFIGSKKGNG